MIEVGNTVRILKGNLELYRDIVGIVREKDGSIAGYDTIRHDGDQQYSEIKFYKKDEVEEGTLKYVWVPVGTNQDDIPKNIPKILHPFYKKLDNDQFGGILLYIPGDDISYAVHVRYGCGDNLTREMAAEGYDDYVIIEVDAFDGYEWHMDEDGGQLDLCIEKDWGGHHNICQHVEDAIRVIGYPDGADYIPLQILK